MKFELFYDTGGYGGPYANFDVACNGALALLSGCRTINRIELRPLDSKQLGGYCSNNPDSSYSEKIGGKVCLKF